MTIARLIDRIRAEFVEMPGLELTPAQAARLWNLGTDDCRAVIELLTDAGFLRWTAAHTVVRTGRALVVAGDACADAGFVGAGNTADKSVALH